MSDHDVRKSASVLDTFRAVAASFFGVRGSKAGSQDVAKLNPVHVIIAGVVMAMIFVFVLISIVQWVVK